MDMKAVLYTDGGSRPNPGHTGYGVHGYVFNLSELDKKTGKRKGPYIPTDMGYYKEEMVKKKKYRYVTPVKYIDVVGSLSYGTNNIAELEALRSGIDVCLSLEVSKVHFKCDSTYVLGYIKKILHNDEFTDPTIPNYKLVQLINVKLNTLRDLGCIITAEYVPAHTDTKLIETGVVLGNVMADYLATMGIFRSKGGNHYEDIKITGEVGYWNSKVPFSDLMTGKRLLCVDDRYKGEAIYEMVTQKDDDSVGMPKSGGYSIVKLNETIPLIDEIRHNTNIALKEVLRPYIVYLDTLASTDFGRLHTLFGLDAITTTSQNKKYRGYVFTRPTIVEDRTSGIMTQAFEAFDLLLAELNMVLSNEINEERYYTQDITEYIYSDGKIVPEYDNKVKLINVLITNDILDGYVPLVPGSDMPNRNVSKRLEKKIDRVILLITNHGPRLTYRTVFILQDGTSGIWSTINQNHIIKATIKKRKKDRYIYKD